MVKRYKTIREFYLFSMVAFIGFSFEFFIRGDSFLGGVLLFNGIINVLAFQQVPRRVATITVILNLFNALISLMVSYNYSGINYLFLFIVWGLLALGYLTASIRQVYSMVSNKSYRQKQKRRVS